MSEQDQSVTKGSERKPDTNHVERPMSRFFRIGFVFIAVLISIPFAFVAGNLLHHLTGPRGSLEIAALILILCVIWPLVILRRNRIPATLAIILFLATAYFGYLLNDTCTGSGGASYLCLSTKSSKDHLLNPEALQSTGTPCSELEVSPLGRGLLAVKYFDTGFFTKPIYRCGG